MSNVINPTRVVVVGSGLSALGAIRALVSRGIVPVVLDVGNTIQPAVAEKALALSRMEPSQWSDSQRKWFSAWPSLARTTAIPRKLTFGSDFFYGTSRSDAPVDAIGNLPPFSYALGGLSCGWGAAILPPQPCDLMDWPIDVDQINKYFPIVLKGLPYSARNDGLSLNFPLFSETATPLRLSPAAQVIQTALEKHVALSANDVLFGQARLLVDARSPLSSDSKPQDSDSGCRYCGQCMSGCVYGAIYKADSDVLALHAAGKIEYRPGSLVDRVAKSALGVTIGYRDESGEPHEEIFERVFLAAGAVNTTRIMLNSLNAFGQSVKLRSRGGFVMPVFSFKRLPSSWPDCNTQPGLFLELKGKGLDHWIHAQISTDNELLLQRLDIKPDERGLRQRLRRLVASHVFVVLINYHSDHAGHYELTLARHEMQPLPVMKSRHIRKFPQALVLFHSVKKILSVFMRIGCIPLLVFARLNSGAYHVGATLPMRERPTGLETDILGRLPGWDKVHVVDTAAFPSLPGTTIGLLAMANAYRIVENLDWSGIQGESP